MEAFNLNPDEAFRLRCVEMAIDAGAHYEDAIAVAWSFSDWIYDPDDEDEDTGFDESEWTEEELAAAGCPECGAEINEF